MIRDSQQIFVASSSGRSLDKKSQVFELSTGSKNLSTKLLDAIAIGAREIGWIRRETPLAELQISRNVGNVPKLREIVPSGKSFRDFGEVVYWRVADGKAELLTAIEPRACRPLAGRRGDLLSSFGGAPSSSTPRRIASNPAVRIASTPTARATTELILQLSSSPRTSPKRTADQVNRYEILLADTMKNSKDPIERARAAYAASALPSSSAASPAPAAASRTVEKKRDPSVLDAELFRAMHTDADRAVQAYASLTLAQRGFDSPEIRTGIGSFEGNALPKNHDLGNHGRYSDFDPIVRDLGVVVEKEKRDLPLSPEIISRILDRLPQIKDKEVADARMDHLIEVYSQTSDPSSFGISFAYLAQHDPVFLKLYADRTNQLVGKNCDKNQNEKAGKTDGT